MIDEHHWHPVRIRGKQLFVSGDVNFLEFEGQLFLQVASHTMNDATEMTAGARINDDADKHLILLYSDLWRLQPRMVFFGRVPDF